MIGVGVFIIILVYQPRVNLMPQDRASGFIRTARLYRNGSLHHMPSTFTPEIAKEIYLLLV